MPPLPQIWAQTSPAQLQLPRIPEDATGARLFGQLAQVSGHIQEGLETVQTARIRGEGAASMMDAINDARLNNADAEQYKTQATQAVQEAYKSAIDEASTPMVKSRVQAALADDLIRARTHIATQYHQKQVDQGLAEYDQFYENALVRFGNAQTEGERENIQHEVGQTTDAIVRKGFMKAAPAQEKLINFHRRAMINYADGLIRTGDFGQYYDAAEKGAFSTLTQADQLSLDRRVDMGVKRATESSKSIKKAQIDDAVDGVAERIEGGENPKAVWDDLSRDLKRKGLFGLEARQRFDQLTNAFKSTKGEDSDQYNTVLDGFERDRSKFGNGIPDRATVAKWLKEVDNADLNIESKRKLRDHFNDWNQKRAQFEQSQETHTEARANRLERQAEHAKNQALQNGEKYLRSAIYPPSVVQKLEADPTGGTLTWSEREELGKSNARFSVLNNSLRSQAEQSKDPFSVYKNFADQISANVEKVDKEKQRQQKVNALSQDGKDSLDALKGLKEKK